MATRDSRKYRDCDPCITNGASVKLAPYLSRLINNIKLEGTAVENVAPDYIVYTLATTGGIVYLKNLNEWTKFTSVGSRKIYGLLPAQVKLWSEERHAWGNPVDVDKDGDILVFPANSEFYAVADKIYELVVSLDTVETNISQNLDNLRQLAVAVTKNKKLRNQLTALNRQRRSGSLALGVLELPDDDEIDLTRTEAEEAITVINLSPNSENYLADYLELKKDYREELNNTIGVTEVGEKTERRINSEMELIENSSYAMIDLLIESINKYAKFYGVDIKAHRAHSGCYEHIDEAAPESGAEEEFDPFLNPYRITKKEEKINNE